MKSSHNRWLLCLIAALIPFTAWADAGTVECETIPTLMENFTDEHVTIKKMDDRVQQRVIDLYLDRLDGAKSLLTQPEYDATHAKIAAMISDIRDGSCNNFDWLYKEQVRWQKEMETFVRETVAAPDFEIDRDVSLQIDPDKRPRPKDNAARDALRLKLIHFQLAGYLSAGEELEEAKKKLVHRYELLTKRVSEQDTQDMYATFLNVFANALDPHSTYFSADDLEDFRISMNLSLEGIGAVLTSRDGYTIVQEVVPGGAAARQGKLKTKDKIIAVSQGRDGDPVDVIDMSLRDVVRQIRGKKGSEVKLTVLRQGERTETLEIVITRDKIDLAEQAAKLRWETIKRDDKELKLAIIELPSFYGGQGPGVRDCVKDVADLLKEINDKGADGLLFDLSANGGGLLQAAVEISGMFIAEGPIVGIGAPNESPQLLEDIDGRIQYTGPVVVLTSRGSASASEILAGALKDYDRAVIVGDDQTFGKGTVQQIVSLPPGQGALKVTTSMFFRPSGQSTQSIGVAADIPVPSPINTDEFGEKTQPYAMPSHTVKAFRGKDINSSDPQKAWTPVTEGQIKTLAEASAKRIATSEAFKEVLEGLAKRELDQGVITVRELLEEKKDGEEEEEEKKDGELTPQATEALQILADLVTGKP